MFVFTNIWLILLTTLFFGAAFFLIKRTASTDIILRLGINKHITEMIIGVIYSGLFILFQLIMMSISSQFSVQIFLVGFVLLTIILNYRVAMYSFPLALVYFLIKTNIDASTYAVVISFLSVSIIYIIFSSFLEGLVLKISLYSASTMIGIISLLVVGIAFDLGVSWTTFAITMLPLLLLPIIETVITYAIKVSVEANILYDSINFVFGRFYRDSIKDRAISEAIRQTKVRQAIYLKLKINFKATNEKEHKEILDSVLNDIQTSVSKEVILFNDGWESYGMFVPTNFQNKLKLSIENNLKESRGINDPLKQIEKYLNSASKTYKTINNELIKIDIFAGAAVYGIQSNSVQRLGDSASFALKVNSRNKNNRITIFDPSLYRLKVIDSYNVQSLDNAINLDNFVNRFTPIMNIKTKQTDYQFVHQINVSESEFIDDVKSYIRDYGLLITFERYFAIDALKKTGDSNEFIIIDYSLERFNEDFLIDEFFRQLSATKIDLNKLILLSDASDVSDIKDLSRIIKIMAKLREKGIKFAINTFEKLKIDFDLYVVSSELLKDTELIETTKTIIVPNVESEETFHLLMDKGINNIGGPLIETNVNANKFKKQSRIYIEELISEKRTNV